jgi:hypothetical protein
MNEKVKLWLIKAFEDYISIKTLLDSPLIEYTKYYMLSLPTNGRKAT